MELLAKNKFWVFVFYMLTIALYPAYSRYQAAWIYTDNFSSTDIEEDSYSHSIFWPEGAYPPSEPFLYYYSGKIGFAGFGQDRLANLVYIFPLNFDYPRKAVSGYLELDVIYLDTSITSSGYLAYSLSPDGLVWSDVHILANGNNNIPIESSNGICYIKFEGKEVLIDNLYVNLATEPTSIVVPGHYSTLQAAIDAASDGDVIEVEPGTYSGNGFVNIDFKGKAITIRSKSGRKSTIIDCKNNGRGFIFQQGEVTDSILCGFTIINASTTGIGGGIYCQSSSPSIIDCVITQCTADTGGGLGAENSKPELLDCVVERCTASAYGGGIALTSNSDASILKTSINDNSCSVNGAGIYILNSAPYIAKCDIVKNYASDELSSGGGVYIEDSSDEIVLKNCIICYNTILSDGGGISVYSTSNLKLINCTIADNSISGISSNSSNINVVNSIIWYNDNLAIWPNISSNINISYTNIQGNYEDYGQDIINQIPMFVSRDPGNYDYHLKSVLGTYNYNTGLWIVFEDHSPCIDAGNPLDPVGNEYFPNKNRINIGAYGGTIQASKSSGPLIFHVNAVTGDDFNTGLSSTSAFRTIKHAVESDKIFDGDIVLVWPGTYEEEIIFDSKAITVQSADDAAIVSAPNGYAFSFYGAESSNSCLRNIIIANCGQGAVFCDSGASPTLINLTIVQNTYGIHTEGGAKPIITNCILWNNSYGDLFGDLYYQPNLYYCCLQQILESFYMGQRGNINKDPLFVDSVNNDFHLKSQFGRWNQDTKSWVLDNKTSQCINAGDPEKRIGREQKPHGDRINMGAFGGTIFASKSAY